VCLKVDQTAFIVASIDNHSGACLGVVDARCAGLVGCLHALPLESTRVLLRSLFSLVPAGLRFAASRSGKSLLPAN